MISTQRRTRPRARSSTTCRSTEPSPRRASWSARFAAGARHDFGRFYHWKGFWYVVGGVAALAAAGIAGGVGGARYQQDQQLARQRQAGIGVVLIGGN